MEKKQTNRGLIGIIILLALLVVGLGSYLVYDKYLKNPIEERAVSPVQKEATTEENYSLGEIKKTYYSLEDAIKEFANIDNQMQYEGNKDKYALIDIDNDGIDDLLIYDAVSEISYDLWILRGSNSGYYLITKLLTNAHYQNTGIKKAKDKNYLITYSAHMKNENIRYTFIKENGYEEINVLNHEVKEETNYEIDKIEDSLKWVEFK